MSDVIRLAGPESPEEPYRCPLAAWVHIEIFKFVVALALGVYLDVAVASVSVAGISLI